MFTESYDPKMKNQIHEARKNYLRFLKNKNTNACDKSETTEKASKDDKNSEVDEREASGSEGWGTSSGGENDDTDAPSKAKHKENNNGKVSGFKIAKVGVGWHVIENAPNLIRTLRNLTSLSGEVHKTVKKAL